MSRRGRSAGAGSRGRGRPAPRGEGLKVRVATAKGRKLASTRWLERQLNDPYVVEAKRQGYRSRAAFKLLQLDEKFRFLKTGARVLDLGCAPGGWLQVAREICGPKAEIVGIDLQETEAVAGATLLVGDFLAEEAPGRIREALGGPADAVLSDMAASATGHVGTDHLRVMALAEAAFDFAEAVLAPGGTFVAKVLHGGAERGLLQRLRLSFAKVRHVKPAASRSDSAEIYLVATGFRGGISNPDLPAE